MKNYYEIMEISETASKEVIERVYKLLAKKYHPDMHQGDDKIVAEEKFKELSEAYETLVDDDKRKLFDESLHREREREHIKQVRAETKYVYSQQPDNYNNSSISHDSGQYSEEDLLNMQAELEYQKAKAYNDAYVKSLRDMGYNVVYKKTFKDYLKILVTLLIFIAVLAMLWFIPYTHGLIIDFYDSLPDFLKNIIESLFNLSK